MNAMRCDPRFAAIWVLILVLITLTACNGMTVTPSPLGEGMRLSMSTQVSTPPCEACAQATLAIALTQEKKNADNQAAATADNACFIAPGVKDAAG